MIEQYPEMWERFVSVTSPRTRRYNCAAWALEMTSTNIRPPLWGWGKPISGEFWPSSVAVRGGTVRAYEEVYELFGYRPCDDDAFVLGTEKLALYAHDSLDCLHVARQLVNGMWTSKMGECADIEHASPEDVAGQKNGQVVAFMARRFGLPGRLEPPAPPALVVAT